MTFRQFMVCLIIGPLCAVFLAGGVVLVFPLMFAICLLMGDRDPLMAAWEIVTVPPFDIFKEAWKGLDD